MNAVAPQTLKPWHEVWSHQLNMSLGLGRFLADFRQKLLKSGSNSDPVLLKHAQCKVHSICVECPALLVMSDRSVLNFDRSGKHFNYAIPCLYLLPQQAKVEKDLLDTRATFKDRERCLQSKTVDDQFRRRLMEIHHASHFISSAPPFCKEVCEVVHVIRQCKAVPKALLSSTDDHGNDHCNKSCEGRYPSPESGKRVPPHNTVLNAKLVTSKDAAPSAHSLITLWTARHSAMPNEPSPDCMAMTHV